MAKRKYLSVNKHTNGYLRHLTSSLITVLTELFQYIKFQEDRCILRNLIINHNITTQLTTAHRHILISMCFGPSDDHLRTQLRINT
jgi:hypothetical protein